MNEKSQNTKAKNTSSSEAPYKEAQDNVTNKILEKFSIKNLCEWDNVQADLIVTDPPFGIKFTGKNGNYHRNVNNVVDGYVEWDATEYEKNIHILLR